MVALFIVCLTVLWLLLIGEYLARTFPGQPEINRKFIHITVGSFVAFWPLILTWNQIILMSLAFVFVVGFSKFFHVFRGIHGVKRATWGEVYFAAVVGIIALVTHDGWIYMAAILHMSLADGFAAIIGIKYGKRMQYTVFGSLKSWIGTATFLVFSVAILFFYAQHAAYQGGVASLLLLAGGATLLENFGYRGLDNLTVPLLVAFVLSMYAG